MIRYLTVEEVARICDVEAGENLLADFGALESAVLRPQTTVGGADAYPDVHSKAAALMHSVVRNHPFIDGNKRTATLAAIIFYGYNGYRFHPEQGALVGFVMDAAEGLLDVDTMAGWLKTVTTEMQFEDEDGESSDSE
jgi:death-on-curing protein